MTLEKFYLASKAVLALSIAGSLILTAFFIKTELTSIHSDVRIEVQNTRKEVIGLVNARADKLQGTITDLFDKTDKRIGSVEDNTFKLANSIREDTVETIHSVTGSLEENTFQRIDVAEKDLNRQIGTLNANINEQLESTNMSVSTLVSAYSGIPAVVAARLDEQTNCQTNGLCWQNLTTDALTNFRYTGRDISLASKEFTKGFPALMKNSQDITTNFAGITANFNKLTKPTWYDKILSYAANGALIYSRLNPVTSLTVSGASLFKK